LQATAQLVRQKKLLFRILLLVLYLPFVLFPLPIQLIKNFENLLFHSVNFCE